MVATGNHYLTDAALGGMTALAAFVICDRWLARARPDVWSFAGGTTLEAPRTRGIPDTAGASA